LNRNEFKRSESEFDTNPFSFAGQISYITSLKDDTSQNQQFFSRFQPLKKF